MRHSGWVLHSLTVESRSTLRRNGKKWDLDNSWPDVFVRAYQGGALIGETPFMLDRQRATWEPWFHVRNEVPAQMVIFDKDVTRQEQMGQLALQGTPEHAPPTRQQSDEFQAELQWSAAHY